MEKMGAFWTYLMPRCWQFGHLTSSSSPAFRLLLLLFDRPGASKLFHEFGGSALVFELLLCAGGAGTGALTVDGFCVRFRWVATLLDAAGTAAAAAGRATVFDLALFRTLSTSISSTDNRPESHTKQLMYKLSTAFAGFNIASVLICRNFILNLRLPQRAQASWWILISLIILGSQTTCLQPGWPRQPMKKPMLSFFVRNAILQRSHFGHGNASSMILAEPGGGGGGSCGCSLNLKNYHSINISR